MKINLFFKKISGLLKGKIDKIFLFFL